MNSDILPAEAPPAALAALPGPVPPARRTLLTTLTLKAPMIGMESARLALGRGEDDILAWIQSGDLEWAFDFRRVRARRAYCRILTESVVRLQRRVGRPAPLELAARKDTPFEAVFNLIFQHRRPVLAGGELSRVWNCGASHIHNLVRDGALAAVEKDYTREGFQFSREKVFKFMQSRRMK
jgi:hypothetical protein